MDDDLERAELQSLMNVIPDKEEVVIDDIPLATKPPSIVDWKIVKEGKISYYQIIRADGSLRRYSAFIQMLRSFDREDLHNSEEIGVKVSLGYTRLEEGYERVLWGDLKTMFEHHVEDAVEESIRKQMLVWKLFDSCGVHFMRYANKKLQTDHLNEMCYQLLKLNDKATQDIK
ncbi:hypothetical protein Tco_1210110 [Tanacetum coccineum]